MTRGIATGSQAAATAVAGLVLACGAGGVAPAQAQTVTQEVFVSLGGEVATNPYLEDEDQGTSVAATMEIRPRLSYDTAVTRFDLEAFARGSAFAEDYGFEDNYGASASVRQRASEQFTLLVNAGVTSTDSPGDTLWTRGDVGSGPGVPSVPEVPVEDVTVLGQRGRTTSITGGAGFEYTASARDRLELRGDYQNVSLSHQGATDYEIGSVEGRYNRIVSQYASIGLIAGYRAFNYEDAASPDAGSLSVLGTVSVQLSEAWTLTAAGGIERTRLDASAASTDRTHTSFSGNASLCWRDPRESLCVDYVRQSQPTGYAGVRNSDSVALSYSFRASEYDRVTLGGTYSRDGSIGTTATASPETELIGVRGGYEHNFNRRLSGYIDASIDRLDRGGVSFDPRTRLGVGIRYLFGRTG